MEYHSESYLTLAILDVLDTLNIPEIICRLCYFSKKYPFPNYLSGESKDTSQINALVSALKTEVSTKSLGESLLLLFESESIYQICAIELFCQHLADYEDDLIDSRSYEDDGLFYEKKQLIDSLCKSWPGFLTCILSSNLHLYISTIELLDDLTPITKLGCYRGEELNKFVRNVRAALNERLLDENVRIQELTLNCKLVSRT